MIIEIELKYFGEKIKKIGISLKLMIFLRIKQSI